MWGATISKRVRRSWHMPQLSLVRNGFTVSTYIT